MIRYGAAVCLSVRLREAVYTGCVRAPRGAVQVVSAWLASHQMHWCGYTVCARNIPNRCFTLGEPGDTMGVGALRRVQRRRISQDPCPVPSSTQREPMQPVMQHTITLARYAAQDAPGTQCVTHWGRFCSSSDVPPLTPLQILTFALTEGCPMFREYGTCTFHIRGKCSSSSACFVLLPVGCFVVTSR